MKRTESAIIQVTVIDVIQLLSMFIDIILPETCSNIWKYTTSVIYLSDFENYISWFLGKIPSISPTSIITCDVRQRK